MPSALPRQHKGHRPNPAVSRPLRVRPPSSLPLPPPPPPDHDNPDADVAAYASPPPPSRWRQKPPEKWGPNNWRSAWLESKAESAADQHLFSSASTWTRLLTAHPESGGFWADGQVGRQHMMPPTYQRTEWVSCPGNPGVHTRSHLGMRVDPECEAWWPAAAIRQRQGCTSYMIGVGGEWDFARSATARDCRVHAYDPTQRLRVKHEVAAAALPNVTFHFAGLSGGSNGVSQRDLHDACTLPLAPLRERD